MQQLRNILILGVLLAPFSMSAQLVPEPVQFTVTPETPGPHESVVILIEGVGSFLGDAAITWKENGVTKMTGAGERIYRFTTGAIGTQTRIDVSINSSVQGLIERTFLFRPSIVHLLWEADTTVPLFYRGKPLYSAGARLKFIAMPVVIINNSLVSSQSLSFRWSRNDEFVPGASGLGRNTFTFDGDQLQRAEDVHVDVYFGGTRVGRGTLSVPAQDPFVLLYSRDPLRGEVLDSALPPAVSLTGKEITLQAEPYYFSKVSKDMGFLSYVWNLNGEEVAESESGGGLLTLRQTGAGLGSAQVAVSVQNNDPDKFVQAAEMALGIVFGEGAASSFSSLFGL